MAGDFSYVLDNLSINMFDNFFDGSTFKINYVYILVEKGGIMDFRRVVRLSCLTLAGLFWASCGDDSNSQAPAPDPEVADPDSSSSTSDDEKLSSAADEKSSSSESAGNSTLSSAEVLEESSSSESVENTSSSSEVSESSSSSIAGYVLAKDPSVTCEAISYNVPACSSTRALTCDDYKKYLASDTTLSEKLLTQWEDKLQKCGAVQEPVALYGIVYDPCANAYYTRTAMKCSNDSTYKDYKLDEENKVYTSIEEYNEAHGISSSSVPESSSSEPEDLVKNCPQEDFALFADVLADVQKKIYEAIVSGAFYEYFGGDSLSDVGKSYVESLLDHEGKTLKGTFAPYLPPSDYEEDVLWVSLKGYSDFWFDGYIARTKTCEGGTPVKTELYQKTFEEIADEVANLIWQTALSKKD